MRRIFFCCTTVLVLALGGLASSTALPDTITEGPESCPAVDFLAGGLQLDPHGRT